MVGARMAMLLLENCMWMSVQLVPDLIAANLSSISNCPACPSWRTRHMKCDVSWRQKGLLQLSDYSLCLRIEALDVAALLDRNITKTLSKDKNEADFRIII
jgi:hypothetical protein